LIESYSFESTILITTENSHDVLIIGGGLAGLSAALHLAERGLKPLVLEADPKYCGGRLAGGDTIEFQQSGQTWRFRLEHGVHGFCRRIAPAGVLARQPRPVFVPARPGFTGPNGHHA
jgi:phytoene dehydrogenase-like protein